MVVVVVAVVVVIVVARGWPNLLFFCPFCSALLLFKFTYSATKLNLFCSNFKRKILKKKYKYCIYNTNYRPLYCIITDVST